MTFRVLGESLHATAEAALKFFSNELGIGKTKFKVETPIHNDLSYRPTIHVVTEDYHYLCIEVSNDPYVTFLDSVVIECRQLGLPVRLYVARPKSLPSSSNFAHQLSQAAKRGVGLVEVNPSGSGDIIRDALSLSLSGVRPLDKKDCPRRYKSSLTNALRTFLNGNPAKGCLDVYEEIEDLTRRIAVRLDKQSLWRTPRKGEKMPSLSSPCSWNKTANHIHNWTSFSKLKPLCPELSKTLIAQLIGITRKRNQTAHKIRKASDLIKRDRKLSTMFEEAVDLLVELHSAAKPLRV